MNDRTDELYFPPAEANELRARAEALRDLAGAFVPASEYAAVQALWADLAEMLWPGEQLTMDRVIVPHEQLALFGEGWLWE